MSFPPFRQGLLPQDRVKLSCQREVMRNGLCEWRRSSLCALPVLQEVEIHSAIGLLLRRSKSPIGDAEYRDSRWKSNSLLGAGNANVQTPLVEMKRSTGQRRHGVDQHQRVLRFLMDDAREGPQIVHHPGGGFVVGD